MRRLDHATTRGVRNTPVASLGQMSDRSPRWHAGSLTHAAFRIACNLFIDTSRKGSDTPYLSHLLAVSALVMEHGGTEIQAAAGLLHDTLEDVKIPASTLISLLEHHGAAITDARAVVEIVEATTDGTPGAPRDHLDWPERKATYLDALRKKDPGHPALLVSLADKVHNSEATLAVIRSGSDVNEFYDQPWFNAKALAQRWYYASLSEVFRAKFVDDPAALPLVQRLESAVNEIFVGVDQ